MPYSFLKLPLRLMVFDITFGFFVVVGFFFETALGKRVNPM
jgi:hypothetical protein